MLTYCGRSKRFQPASDLSVCRINELYTRSSRNGTASRHRQQATVSVESFCRYDLGYRREWTASEMARSDFVGRRLEPRGSHGQQRCHEPRPETDTVASRLPCSIMIELVYPAQLILSNQP